MTVFEMAQKYYPRLWDESRIRQLMAAERLTTEQYKTITGKNPEL